MLKSLGLSTVVNKSVCVDLSPSNLRQVQNCGHVGRLVERSSCNLMSSDGEYFKYWYLKFYLKYWYLFVPLIVS